jgi:hypothetical protein
VLLPAAAVGLEQYASMELQAEDVALAEQVDQLEAVLDAAWRMPGTGRMLADRTLMLELIDEMRVAIPEQVQAAQQVLQRRDQLLAAAKAEADSIIAEARREAWRRLTEEVAIQVAARRAAQIEAQAWRAAEALERQTDQAAAEWLRSLHVRLKDVDRVLAQPLPLSGQADNPRNHVSATAPVGMSASQTRRRRAA